MDDRRGGISFVLIACLFAFAASDRKELGELPIRLWDRYLPDYFDEVPMGLYDMPLKKRSRTAVCAIRDRYLNRKV